MNDKNKIIISNSLGAFFIKGGALIISLFTMPAYIDYFNNQIVLGVWFTILSILSWILTFDLGIGNGLRNNLVIAFAKSDYDKAKKYISSAYITIGIIVLLISIVANFVFKYIDFNSILSISNSIISSYTLNNTILIVFTGIMIQFLLKLITSVLYALQKSALTNLLNLVTSLINLIYVLIANKFDISSSITSLAIVQVMAVNIPLLLVSIILFSTNLKKCRPSLFYFRTKYSKSIMKLGGMFFWIQIMYMLLTATNEFLITWLVSADKVVDYQIYNKLFTLIGTLFSLALTPIWSAVTKALGEQDYNWIKKVYKNLKYTTLFAVLIEFLMIIFLQTGMDLWLGTNSIEVNYKYAFIFAISGSIFIWSSALTSIANGIGELKIQSICFTIGAIIKVPLAILLVNFYDSWISIILANILSMILFCIIQPLWIDYYLKNKEIGDEEFV